MAVKREVFRQDMGPCTVCRRLAYTDYGGGAVKLKDGAPLCGDCVRRIRFLYPKPRPQMKKGMWLRNDPLSDLTAEEVRAAAAGAPEKLEDLREQYSFRGAVFRVDSLSVEKQGLFKAPKNTFSGSVLYGRFNLGERVELLDGDAVTDLVLEDVVNPNGDGSPGEAGYETQLSVEGKGLQARPGCLIVKG